MTEEDIKQMQAEIERLRADNARLQSEMIRLVSRNLNLSEQLEVDVELRRRSDVARTLMKENIERQRNAEESGFNHVRTLQRRIMDVTGMTPADYRALFTRDM